MPSRVTDAGSGWARFTVPLAYAGLLAVLVSLPVSAQMEIDGNAAADVTCHLTAGEPGTVAEVVDGDTLILADGRVVRMAGVEAPKPHLAMDGANIDEFARAAHDALEGFVAGARIEIRLGEFSRDRHDRTLAQVYLGDGTWLQEAMVEAGFVRVRPFAGDFSCLGDLVKHERGARDMARGLWRSAEYSVVSAYDPSLIERKGLYVLVEGWVVSVGHGNRVDFLNFGRNWRHDFTVIVGSSLAGRFADSGLPIDGLAEQRVRVRGVIEESGGSAIRLNDPGEIEVLGND